ncbi:MAG: hypothetical protein B0D92_00710 [Spirochaeta sp. LUC14_002_19_P3]|nr:MAG: hypothetical protein B0D92_00710 [Spirochaeta sp. LUC14_002_19_P3]
MIDLHTHSNQSDGELSPAELITRAGEIGLSAIALTDHDTTAGIDEAQAQADKVGIRFIPGVEIHVDFYSGEFHLLGLGLKMNRISALNSFLHEIRRRRAQRNNEMIKLMRNDGMDITLDKLNAYAGSDVVGRLHFAHWFIDAGKAKNIPDVFKRWLGPEGPYYIRKNLPSLKEAISSVHSAGGKAVIAHPKSLRLSYTWFETCLSEWRALGLDGIEALHSGNTGRESRRLAKIADELGMIITGGSDFHGTSRPDRRLGFGAAGMEISDELLAPFNDE